jgi:hypothetical protein
MADVVDLAQQIEQEHLQRALQAISGDIPAGAPGECELCGEETRRLVEGRCAPCREPRVPRRSVFQ